MNNSSIDRTAKLQDGPSSDVGPVPDRRLHSVGWISRFLAEMPEAAAEIQAAGIRDDESYLEKEATLTNSIRTTLGQFRCKFLMDDSSDPLNMVRFAPPWLRAQELSALPLTVRLGNFFKHNRILLVSDLDRYSNSALLALGNFGHKSMKHLFEALHAGLHRGAMAGDGLVQEELNNGSTQHVSQKILGVSTPSANELGLIGNMLEKSKTLNERGCKILFARMSFDQSQRTLEDLGREFGVTRERVRQIENQSLQRITAGELWDELLVVRVHAILANREEPMPLSGLATADEWFRGTAERLETLTYLIKEFGENKIHVVKVGSELYVARIDQSTWDAKLSEAKQILVNAVDLNRSEAKCRQAVESILPKESPELASLLWSEASRLCHFSGPYGRRVLSNYGDSSAHVVQVVLEDSAGPLSTSKMAEMASALGKTVGESQIRHWATRIGFLLARGTYGLRKHVPLSDAEIERIAQMVEDIVRKNPASRQWHTAELVAKLQEIDLSMCEQLDKYLVNAALKIKSRLTYLGHFVWVLPETDEQQRVELKDTIIEILTDAGQPLTKQEIKRRVIKVRGVNSSFNVIESDPLIRVGRSLWGLNDRDLPIKRDRQPLLIEKVHDALSRKGSGIYLDEVNRLVDFTPQAEPEIIVSIAILDSRIRTGKGRIMYLAEWGDPRRVSVNEAIKSLSAQRSETMNIGAIQDWAESTCGRKIDRTVLYKALTSSGAQNLEHGVWKFRAQKTSGADGE